MINEFSGYRLDGKMIIVEKKRPSMINKGSARGGSQICYKCGKPGHFAR